MPARGNNDGEEKLKKILTGNEAVSTAVRLARVEVIAAYPITPQTSISEKLSLYCARGEMDADFIKVESEHSALACVVGAASAGVRTFTATSSQGLALMHELLHWASGARLPIVMANVNRALGAPWNIWGDHSDSISQRDTGWLQVYCESCQEVLDTVLMSFRMAEAVATPVMVMLDGFFLSHTAEQVDIPDQDLVDSFLPKYESATAIDPENPRTYHAVTSPDYFMEFKYKQFEGAARAEQVAEEVGREYEKLTGRYYGALECFMTEDAETILVAKGTSAGTCKHVVRKLRGQGKKVGLVRLRTFRPFPFGEIRRALGAAARVAVLDQSVSPGSEGVVCQEIKSALYDGGNSGPSVYGFIGGLGGRDITPENIEQMIEAVESGQEEQLSGVNWVGLKS
ncbi:MAG: pyruvate ferredoxin oxidoreductase [Gemmatimonadota bacterium]|nr:pyruvate ferredoxin oxidoreductase [Gemmatimonadota bacterium]